MKKTFRLTCTNGLLVLLSLSAQAEPAPASYSSNDSEAAGTLASDEALAALREKLTNN